MDICGCIIRSLKIKRDNVYILDFPIRKAFLLRDRNMFPSMIANSCILWHELEFWMLLPKVSGFKITVNSELWVLFGQLLNVVSDLLLVF